MHYISSQKLGGLGPVSDRARCGAVGTPATAPSRDRPDLVVLDLMLPDADGWEITQQVLHNLLGGQIIIAARPHLASTPAVIEVSVSDTGRGIAPEDLRLVFDRFWRADRSRSREQGGSGLGLVIARQLVHDGRNRPSV